MLLEKAEQLAQREIARMSAAELLYRNTATAHRIINGDLGVNVGVHTKIYRAFHDYRITDIVRSDSYLNPVTYEITYVYDILATEPRSFSAPDAEKLARSDAQFKRIANHQITRRYPADDNGEFVGILPELLPRPDFYTRDAQLQESGGALSPTVTSTMGAPPVAPGGMTPGTAALAVPPGLQPNFATGELPGVRMIDPPLGPPTQK